jgi:serine/threonine protein kinase
MAPEVMCRKNHTFNVDFFALGVMGYEFMLGKRPYVGKNRKEIRDQILAKQAEIKPEEVPRGWSLESIDFINRLLIRNPHYRLGTGGIE